MMRELLSSVRDVNHRLVELKDMLQQNLVKEEKRYEIKQRYQALMNTRFCLIYSIYDVRQKFVNQISDEYTKKDVEKKFQVESIFEDLKKL